MKKLALTAALALVLTGCVSLTHQEKSPAPPAGLFLAIFPSLS